MYNYNPCKTHTEKAVHIVESRTINTGANFRQVPMYACFTCGFGTSKEIHFSLQCQTGSRQEVLQQDAILNTCLAGDTQNAWNIHRYKR